MCEKKSEIEKKRREWEWGGEDDRVFDARKMINGRVYGKKNWRVGRIKGQGLIEDVA